MMTRFCLPLRRVLAGVLVAMMGPALAQTLVLDHELQRSAAVTNTTVTMTGHSELHLSGTGDPLAGSTVHLNSEDAWVFLPAIVPSAAAGLLSHIRVNGAAAALGVNVRVVQHVNGAVIIPHAPGYRPLEVFTGREFTGTPGKLGQYTGYGWQELGVFNDTIRSFRLKRGYTATFARNADGTGPSRNYVAQDADLEVAILPDELDRSISFVRVFPWRWTAKKGTCDADPAAFNARWHYNWNISHNSPLDWEYVAIKQQPWWPGLNQDWRTRGVNHLLGFNEPNNPVEDAYKNLTPQGSVSDAVARMPELLGTGLRLGAPAVTDGGTSWIIDFVNQAKAAGHRLDYVPIHYYRASNNTGSNAASQLYNFLKTVYDATGLPIWVTEFNNGANWTTAADPSFAQNRDCIEAMINMMDSTPWIERYSLYSNVEEVRQLYYNSGGLTPMGTMYRDHLSPLGHQQVVPDSGKSPAADYLFEGNTRDTSGSGNNPLVTGTPKIVPGRHGQALSLDGSEDFLTLPPRVGDSVDFTFSGWVKWNGGGSWQRIFDLGNGTANNLFLTPQSGSNTLRFAIKQNNGAEQQLNTGVLPTGVWTHLAVTLAGDTGKLFVNGALRDTRTITLNPVDIGTTTNYLGKSQWPDPLFNGQLDSIRFLTRALSDAEIAAAAAGGTLQFTSDPLVAGSAVPMQPFTATIADSAGAGGGRTFAKLGGPAWLAVAANGSLTGVPMPGDTGLNTFLVQVTDGAGLVDTAALQVTVAAPPGLTARFPFNGHANAAVGSLHGTASGGPAYTAGVKSNALVLDGADDFVTLPAGIANHDAITIATWVWWNGGATWQRIFDFGNGQADNFFLTPRSGGNTLRVSINKDGVSQELNAPQLAANTWTHLAVTLGGGTGRLYVNGALVDSRAVSLKPSDLLPAVNYLGKSQWPDPLFAGRLDEFMIFNRALAGQEIVALQSGNPPVFPGDPIQKPSASVGTAYVSSVSATGSGLTYSKAAGPKWLTVEPDGRISGVPGLADVGTNRFTVRATAAHGDAAEAALVIAVSPTPGLVSLHQFHGSPADAAGTFHATPLNGAGYGPAIFDQGLLLDGVDDHATLPAGVVGGLTDITLAMRFRWDGGNAWQRVFDFGRGTNSYFYLSPQSGGGRMKFAITSSDSGGEQTLEAAPAPVGEWTHVAITLSGDTGTLHVNGAAVDSRAITLDPANVAATVAYLGRSQFTADPYFRGMIDDFRIYNRGLSAGEIAALAVPPAAIVVPRDDYAVWSAAFPFAAGQELPLQDPDGDQVANVFEFLFGTHPLEASGNALPQARVRTAAELGLAGDKTYLTLSARVRAAREGVLLTAEGAATPAGLAEPAAAGHAIQAGAPVAAGQFEVLTWYYDVPLEDAPAGFMRLRAGAP